MSDFAYQVGQEVWYLMGYGAQAGYVSACVRYRGIRRNGNTYYTIQPIVNGIRLRPRNVAFYSIKGTKPDSASAEGGK